MIFDYLKTLPQYLIPQHGVTKLIGKLANCTINPWKNWAIKAFIKSYKVDMQLALIEDGDQYACFNDFFIRKLKPELRPIANGANDIASPVDGGVSQLSKINAGKIFNAKGHYFDLEHLLGGNTELSAQFNHGNYISLYLSPRDYHRVHMPIAGSLIAMTYIPGKLFSVQNSTLRAMPDIFANNERAILVFETEFGPMIMVLVGAMIVASINTVWQGEIGREGQVRHWEYDQLYLAKGAEVGHFKLGSTVILLFPNHQTLHWEPQLQLNTNLQYGQKIGALL